jgi:glycosyltransferase involved in cell wall biosynthesis
MPLISVIVPFYNVETYLSACLDSLIQQTFQDFVIIAINDGSTDESTAILERYATKFPERFEVVHQVNQGIAEARNEGLARVKTKYFAFLDGDDVADVRMLERLIQEAESSQADLVIGNFYWSYVNREKLETEQKTTNHKTLLVNVFTVLWNKLYRTEAFLKQAVRFPKGLRYEDAAYLYQTLPQIHRWSYVDLPVVHYNQRENSITHQFGDRVNDMIEVFKIVHQHYIDQQLWISYASELEYITLRFFLGNSFVRAAQIDDPGLRDRSLTSMIDYLYQTFPNWRHNPYLKRWTGKHIYFSLIDQGNYRQVATLIRFAMRFKAKFLNRVKR